ncbi:hypothetical protein C8F04DRAFT_1277220 [Mycena alexandri]|uniref:Uncharacterized protein n=1 Tax=Mycena alexandri TaxID=1745969 RepID=A0AAD6S037_9AGAR|nr:hypothetical protein C8F04DRAFT_1277220 [Mycena alexandri]
MLTPKRRATKPIFFVTLDESWFKKWPEEAALGLPARESGVPLSEEENQTVSTALKTRKKLKTLCVRVEGVACGGTRPARVPACLPARQLRSWFRNHIKTQRDSGAVPVKKSDTESFAAAIWKDKTRHRGPQVVELYQKLYPVRVRNALQAEGFYKQHEKDVEWVSEDGEGPGGELKQTLKEQSAARMRVMRRVTRALVENEEPDVLEKLEQEIVRLKELSLTEGSSELTPEKAQRSLDQLEGIVSNFHKILNEKTGWVGFTMVGGPTPNAGGALSLQVFSSGLTPAGHTFRQAHSNWKTAVSSPFTEFLKKCFPRSVRDAMALPDPVEDLDDLIRMSDDDAEEEAPTFVSKTASPRKPKKKSKKAKPPAPVSITFPVISTSKQTPAPSTGAATFMASEALSTTASPAFTQPEARTLSSRSPSPPLPDLGDCTLTEEEMSLLNQFVLENPEDVAAAFWESNGLGDVDMQDVTDGPTLSLARSDAATVSTSDLAGGTGARGYLSQWVQGISTGASMSDTPPVKSGATSWKAWGQGPSTSASTSHNPPVNSRTTSWSPTAPMVPAGTMPTPATSTTSSTHGPPSRATSWSPIPPMKPAAKTPTTATSTTSSTHGPPVNRSVPQPPAKTTPPAVVSKPSAQTTGGRAAGSPLPPRLLRTASAAVTSSTSAIATSTAALRLAMASGAPDDSSDDDDDDTEMPLVATAKPAHARANPEEEGGEEGDEGDYPLSRPMANPPKARGTATTRGTATAGRGRGGGRGRGRGRGGGGGGGRGRGRGGGGGGGRGRGGGGDAGEETDGRVESGMEGGDVGSSDGGRGRGREGARTTDRGGGEGGSSGGEGDRGEGGSQGPRPRPKPLFQFRQTYGDNGEVIPLPLDAPTGLLSREMMQGIRAFENGQGQDKAKAKTKKKAPQPGVWCLPRPPGGAMPPIPELGPPGRFNQERENAEREHAEAASGLGRPGRQKRAPKNPNEEADLLEARVKEAKGKKRKVDENEGASGQAAGKRPRRAGRLLGRFVPTEEAVASIASAAALRAETGLSQDELDDQSDGEPWRKGLSLVDCMALGVNYQPDEE